MKQKTMKSLLTVAAITAALTGTNAFAAEAPALTPGVTVTANESSATGYTVTFVYEAPDAQQVQLRSAFTSFHL